MFWRPLSEDDTQGRLEKILQILLSKHSGKTSDPERKIRQNEKINFVPFPELWPPVVNQINLTAKILTGLRGIGRAVTSRNGDPQFVSHPSHSIPISNICLHWFHEVTKRELNKDLWTNFTKIFERRFLLQSCKYLKQVFVYFKNPNFANFFPKMSVVRSSQKSHSSFPLPFCYHSP